MSNSSQRNTHPDCPPCLVLGSATGQLGTLYLVTNLATGIRPTELDHAEVHAAGEAAVERFTTPRLTTVPDVVAAKDSRAWDLPMQTTSKWLGTAQTAPRLARPGGSGSVRACGRCLPCSAWMCPTGAVKAWLAPQRGTPSVERGSLARVEFRVVVPTEGAASLNREVRTSVHGEGYPSLVI